MYIYMFKHLYHEEKKFVHERTAYMYLYFFYLNLRAMNDIHIFCN